MTPPACPDKTVEDMDGVETTVGPEDGPRVTAVAAGRVVEAPLGAGPHDASSISDNVANVFITLIGAR